MHANALCALRSRRQELEQQLDEAEVPEEEQARILAELGKKEAELMRVQRRKTTVDDFELLTIIGRGAFGEVRAGRGSKAPGA